MFGFQGGESAGTVARKKGHVKDAQRTGRFLANSACPTIQTEGQLSSMVKIRSGISPGGIPLHQSRGRDCPGEASEPIGWIGRRRQVRSALTRKARPCGPLALAGMPAPVGVATGGALDERAGEEAGPVDVGDQALMRGLATAVPMVRPRRSLSKHGHRRRRPHNVQREFLCRGPASTLARWCGGRE